MSKEASLATASPNRGNNFDSLRILAALGVLVSHAFPLSGAGDREPILQISLRQTTAGTLAVSVFFVISGYLITKSYDRSHSARAFVIGRVLRLVPALAVVELLLSFCAGLLLTHLSTADYLSQMSLYTNILVNLSCLGFRDGLPGVFLHNPFPHAVDGSLWTLEYEVACYGMVLVVGYLGLLNRYVMGAGYMTALIALRYWVGGYYVSFGTYFLAGATIYLWRPTLRGDVAALCGCLWTISLLWAGIRLTMATAGAYGIIYLAEGPEVRFPRLARFGDVSYGIYIWAFPVQQWIAHILGTRITWYWDAALSLPIVLAIAALSWKVIEAPSLSLKRRWAGSPARSSAVAVARS